MSGSIEGVNRRAFVAAGLAATAGARLGRAEGPGDPPQTETPKRPGPRTVKLPRSGFETRELAIARAHERGMTVIGMKCLGGFLFNEAGRRLVPDFDEAKRERLPATALRWGFSDPRITLWAVGMDKESDVDRNLALISGDLALTDADRTLLAEYSAKLWQAKPIRDMERPFAKPGIGYLEPYIVDLLKRQGIDPEPYRRQVAPSG